MKSYLRTLTEGFNKRYLQENDSGVDTWQDAYAYFTDIVDKEFAAGFPDLESVEEKVAELYLPHKGEPIWDEAWERWNSFESSDIDDGWDKWDIEPSRDDWDIDEDSYYPESFVEDIRVLAKHLNESSTSTIDKKEATILESIYNKLKNGTCTFLSLTERAVLKKYGFNGNIYECLRKPLKNKADKTFRKK